MWLRGLVVLTMAAGTALTASQDLYSNSEPEIQPQSFYQHQSSPYSIESTLYNLLYQPQSQEENEGDLGGRRGKRTGASLSVVNPIDVLRSKLMLEIARRRMQQQDNSQLISNRKFLNTVGKRQAVYFRPAESGESDQYLNNNGLEQSWDRV